MRHRVLVLLALLLLLRGWVGEAVAGQMLAQQLHHASAASVQAVHMPDCHEAMEAPAASDDDAAGPAPHGSCAQCQDCSLAALPATVALAMTHALPARPDTPHAQRFASAEVLQGVKPPIS